MSTTYSTNEFVNITFEVTQIFFFFFAVSGVFHSKVHFVIIIYSFKNFHLDRDFKFDGPRVSHFVGLLYRNITYIDEQFKHQNISTNKTSKFLWQVNGWYRKSTALISCNKWLVQKYVELYHNKSRWKFMMLSAFRNTI